jgi:colicin import membrane protein
VQDSRRGTGFILSLVLHALLITVGMLNLSANLKVDMDKPMYTVDLVSLNPSENPAAGDTGEPAPAPPPLAENQPQEQTSASAAVPPPPQAKAEKAKPEPVVRDDAKLISEKKVEEKKKLEKKQEKQEEKTPPKPTKPEEKKLSREELLKQALQDVKKDVSEKSKNAKPTAKSAEELRKEAVAGEVAALRKSTGGNIFTAGGTGPGGAGGGKGKGAGGTGSGLSSVYGDIVAQIVRSHWRSSRMDREHNIVVTLEINIDPTGKITGAHVVKSSGNPVFDDSAVRAALETGAVPSPANKNLGTLHLNFNSSELMK